MQAETPICNACPGTVILELRSLVLPAIPGSTEHCTCLGRLEGQPVLGVIPDDPPLLRLQDVLHSASCEHCAQTIIDELSARVKSEAGISYKDTCPAKALLAELSSRVTSAGSGHGSARSDLSDCDEWSVPWSSEHENDEEELEVVQRWGRQIYSFAEECYAVAGDSPDTDDGSNLKLADLFFNFSQEI